MGERLNKSTEKLKCCTKEAKKEIDKLKKEIIVWSVRLSLVVLKVVQRLLRPDLALDVVCNRFKLDRIGATLAEFCLSQAVQNKSKPSFHEDLKSYHRQDTEIYRLPFSMYLLCWYQIIS